MPFVVRKINLFALFVLSLLFSNFCYANETKSAIDNASYNGCSADNGSKIHLLGQFEKYWLQYSNDGDLLFRYLVNDTSKSCPIISVDGIPMNSKERGNEYYAQFPVKICQLVVDNSKEHLIKFKTMNIKSKVEGFKKISVLGDTGCITEGKLLEQDCKSLPEHPFSEIASNIAKERPDLIIHVGDYFYSKEECIDKLKCGGRPFGDNIATWKADFIDDASRFFNSAPIIFARGNHEECKRGGKGWSVLFDGTKDFRKCSDYTKPYSVEFKDIRFLILDSASASDSSFVFNKLPREKKSNQAREYREQFNLLAEKVNDNKQNILVTHRPIFSKEIRSWVADKVFDINYSMNKAINASDFKKKLSKIDMILSGHTHTAFLIDIPCKKKHLYQVVSGNGGAYLYKKDVFAKNNNKIFGRKVDLVYNNKEFGYNNLTSGKNGQVNSIEFCDWNGNKLARKDLNSN